jgi:DNA-binding NtrC family response regulator
MFSRRQTIPSKQERTRILVADDQPHILEAVELLLAPQGIAVDCVRSPQLLLEALGQSDYDVLLIDLNYTRDTTSGQEGLDLLARIQEYDARLPVIVMTAWGNIDLAVESIKRGARDFIQKPWENERLISLVRVHAELHRRLRRARQLELENRLLRAEGMPEFVAGAPSMQPVLELIAQVGRRTPTCSSPASTGRARRSSPSCCMRLRRARAWRWLR